MPDAICDTSAVQYLYQLDLLEVPLTGTLGVLVDAKQAGLIPAVAPLLDRLEALRFHLDDGTRAAVLDMAGETGEST